MSNDTTAHIAYKYRLYPTKAQEQALDVLFWKARQVYNLANAIQMKRFEHPRNRPKVEGEKPERKVFVFGHYDLAKHLARWAKLPKIKIYDWLFDDTIAALAERNVLAWKAFFAKIKKCEAKRINPPRFRSRSGKNPFTGLPFRRSGYKFHEGDPTRKQGYLEITRGNVPGRIRVITHRPLPDGAKIKRVLITRDGEQWHVTLQLETPPVAIPQTYGGAAIGIDLGLKFLVAMSDGTTVGNPQWYTKTLKELRRLGRKMDRQRRANNPQNFNPDGTVKRGVKLEWHNSNRYLETKGQVARLHRRVRQQRDYFWQTLTDDLTKRYQIICIEALELEFMRKNSRLSMPVADAALGTFWRLLDEKAAKRGVAVIRVPAAYTSQRCAKCGHVESENRKTQTEFRCVSCGHSDNADVNAAKNILAAGLALRKQECPSLRDVLLL